MKKHFFNFVYFYDRFTLSYNLFTFLYTFYGGFMSTKRIDDELGRMRKKLKMLMLSTQEAQVFRDIPIFNFFISSESHQKMFEHDRLKRKVQLVKAYIKQQKLTDENFISHVFQLLGYEYDAVKNKVKFKKSDIGKHFRALGLGACDTEDWGQIPHLEDYTNFALKAFDKDLSEEEKVKLKFISF